MNLMRSLRRFIVMIIIAGIVLVQIAAMAVEDLPNASNNVTVLVSEGIEVDLVQTIQLRLMALDYMVVAQPNNIYDETTKMAVQKFQENNLLPVNGIVDQPTYEMLMSDQAVRASAAALKCNIESLISVAESKLGCKYVRKAKGPNAFDCSGFVYWCLNQAGVSQGYMTSRAWASNTNYTKITNIDEMQRGDIVVYSGHVAIYAGDGVIIDASSCNGKVVKRSCTSPWYRKNFICAYRVF